MPIAGSLQAKIYSSLEIWKRTAYRHKFAYGVSQWLKQSLSTPVHASIRAQPLDEQRNLISISMVHEVRFSSTAAGVRIEITQVYVNLRARTANDLNPIP